MVIHSLLVGRRKGESQNGGHKKTKHAKFSKKTNISCPWNTYMSNFAKAWSPDFFKNLINVTPLPVFRNLQNAAISFKVLVLLRISKSVDLDCKKIDWYFPKIDGKSWSSLNLLYMVEFQVIQSKTLLVSS